MEESIKVYVPKAALKVEEKLNDWNDIMVDRKTAKKFQMDSIREQLNAGPKKTTPQLRESKHSETGLETLKRVLIEHEANTRVLEQRHPWVAPTYKGLLALLLAFLLVSSFLIWGINKKNEKEEGIRATAYADGQADLINKQKAAAEEEANSEAAKKKAIEDQKTSDIQLMSKLLAGIQGFVENKGYTDADLETYGQCAVNRVLNPAFECSTLEEAIKKEGQWVGFSINNQPTIKHQQIAKKLVERFYNEEPQPCSFNYCWTEFTDKGLWLKNDYGPATFNNTWRAGA